MRSYAQAKAFAVQQHRAGSDDWFRLCQMFSRQCVGAGPFGGSARLAFNALPDQHKHRSSPPPAGSIAYYGPVGSGAGHAVFVVEGGKVWSNDIKRRGRIDRVSWDVFPSAWGLAYRGWIEACPDGSLPVQRGGRGGGGGGGGGARDEEDRRERFRQDRKVFRSRMRFRQGDSNSVWNLQLALMRAGFPFADGPTAYYGRHTRRCCARFQRRQGWRGPAADGMAGPLTIQRLNLEWVDA